VLPLKSARKTSPCFSVSDGFNRPGAFRSDTHGATPR
jgi:hypothetical protein